MRSAAILCAVLCVLVVAVAARADVPGIMSYQGVLKDTFDVRVEDGYYDMTFRLYNTAVGGSPMWTEDQYIPIEDGIFSVTLGAFNPLTSGFGQELWLGVSVEYGAELFPRTKLTASPYAFHAAVADSVSGFVPSGDSDWFFNGTGDIYRLSDNVGIGISQPQARLEVDTGNSVAVSAASDSIAGVFVGTGNGGGLVTRSEGYGAALHAWSAGSGYAGYFGGSGPLRVDTECDVKTFRMTTGATAGCVLTSDGSGLGTWQTPAASPDGDWTVSGDDMYSSLPGNVGIGTESPEVKLHVDGGEGTAVLLESTGEQYDFGLKVDNAVGTAAKFQSGPHTESYPGVPAAVYGVAGGGHNAAQFVAHDAGGGVVAYAGGGGTAVYGRADSTGTAVSGLAAGTGHAGHFVGGDGVKVEGDLEVTSSSARTAEFYSDTTDPHAHVIHAEATGTEQVGAIAVYGESISAPETGIGGHFRGGHTGAEGEVIAMDPVGTSCTGLRGYAFITGTTGNSYGVYGLAYGGYWSAGVQGSSTGGQFAYGVYGSASGGSLATAAGYFNGDVHVSGNLSKGAGSFKIDHPLDPEHKYLSHSFVESPDMMNVYNGNVVLDGAGEATVELPEWFDVLNRDFRYQLTAIGAPGPNLYIADEIRGNSFRIAGGEPHSKVSWQVTGIRQDKYAEEHRIVVEQEKLPHETGRYLHPELYGVPRTEGIGYMDPGNGEVEH